MQSSNQSFSINDSRNQFISLDSQNNPKSLQTPQSITQMMQFFQMMKQNPIFMTMMNPQNIEIARQDHFNNGTFRQPTMPNYSNVKPNVATTQQSNYLDQKYLPKQQASEPRTRRHQRGKDVLKSYEKKQVQTQRNTQESKILEQIGDSFVSNYQQQIPRVINPVKQVNKPYYKPDQNIIAQKIQNFDDIPIRPMKGNQFDQTPINSQYAKNPSATPKNMLKKNNKLNFENKIEQQPIKSQYTDGLKTSRQYERNESFAYQKNQMINSPRKEQLYIQMEDRPISGCQNKNFDQIINEQLTKQGISTAYSGSLESVESPQTNNQNRPKPAKTFLRKGTREHLSSGRDKRMLNPKKKAQKNTNNQSYNFNEEASLGNAGRDYSMDRDLTPKNNRSTSQNRVLNNKKREDLSVSKAQPPKIDTREKKHFTKTIDTQDNLVLDKSISNSINLPPKNTKTIPVKSTKNDASPKNSRNANQYVQKSPKAQNKPKINVFQDSDSSENQGSAQFPNKSFQNKKIEVIPGIFLSEQQIQQIVRKNSRTLKQQQQKLQKLRGKYNDLCQIIQQQRVQLKQQLQNEKIEFQNYKAAQMTKIKNQRRVMQRQVKSSVHGKQSNKEQVQAIRKQLQREKQESKKKDKNNRLIIQKYKKEADQLRIKLSTLQSQPINYHSDQNQHQQSLIKASQVSKSTKAKQQPKRKKVEQEFTDANKNTVQKKQQYQTAYSSYGNSKQTVKGLPQYNAIKSNAAKKTQKFNYVDDDSKNKKTQSNRNKFCDSSSNEEDKNSGSDQDHQPSFGRGNTKNYNQDTQQYYPVSTDLTNLAKEELSIKKVTPQLIDKLFRYNKHPEYIQYLNKKLSPGRKIVHSSENTVDGRTTHIYNDDGKQIIFTTGVKKEYFPNGYMIIHFKNGDIKQKLSNGTILYYFYEKQVDQITFPNQTNVYRFQNNQIEFHFPDSRIQIRHADGTIKVMSSQ